MGEWIEVFKKLAIQEKIFIVLNIVAVIVLLLLLVGVIKK